MEKKKMKENMIIRLERENEYHEVENLVRESFWNVYRPGCLEHYVLHQLRNDPAFVPELDFVMTLDGQLIGQNMFMKAVIAADDGRSIPIMTMGPICIARKAASELFVSWKCMVALNLIGSRDHMKRFASLHQTHVHSGCHRTERSDPADDLHPVAFFFQALMDIHIRRINGRISQRKEDHVFPLIQLIGNLLCRTVIVFI